MSRAKFPVDAEDLGVMTTEWIKGNVEEGSAPTRRHVFTFAASGTEYRIRHRIPTRASGWRIIRQDQPGQVYATRQADRFYLYLQSDTAGLTVTLEAF